MDISASLSYKDIEKYGLELGQTVFVNEKNKGFITELETRPDVSYVPGGSIENSLRVCCWCLNLKEYNKKCDLLDKQKNKFKLTMLGCIGKDKNGEKIKQSLSELGVNFLFEVNQTLETSSCGVSITDKERTLLSNIKASAHISNEFIEKNKKEILSHDILMIEGFFINENFELCRRLSKEFKEKGKIVILTLSSVFVVKEHFMKVKEIAELSNYIFCNSDEAKAFARTDGNGDMELVSKVIHQNLHEIDNRALVITCGPNGVMISKFNYKANQMDFFLHVYCVFIPVDEIVDLNGAGDAFLGGFISQFMKGKPYNLCASAGNSASSYILKKTGCSFDTKVKFEYNE